jgi:hypothetical protein
LASPTPTLTAPTTLATPTDRGPSPASGRCPQMPTRSRTRARDRRYHITHERRINEARLAEEHRQHEAWLAATYEPPPF